MRAIVHDVSLADALWPRVRALCPDVINDSMGDWVPFGLSER